MIKVAGYCRVSTDKEDQANSFLSQQRYFREYIARHPDWQLHEIYADEGITGTSVKKRVQFNRMIHDAYRGCFKIVLTKEVSRFSRNILDTIAYTRELKTLGIGVVFLNDGFCSLDADAELRLSIMGSIAQEESRKTSSRVKWGQTRQMERGVVFGRSLLGYDLEQGTLSVNARGAEIVREIFYKYAVEKKGTTVIARELREAGLRTHSGNALWSDGHILKILKNEKYVGDLVQKKTITPDYLTHEKKYNRGEEDLIIIRDHHEPIISRALWDQAQAEIRKRHRTKNGSGEHSNRYIFSGKILCAECGARFVARKKVRKDGTSYRRWGCYTASRYGKGKTDSQGNVLGCDVGKQIRDDLAVDMLKSVIKSLPIDRDRVIRNLYGILIKTLLEENREGEAPKKLTRQMESLQERNLKAIDAYLSGELTKEEYAQVRSLYDSQLTQLRQRLEDLCSQSQTDEKQMTDILRHRIAAMISCEEVSEAFFKALLESLTVRRDGTAAIKLHQLPTVWNFQFYTGSCRDDTSGR